MGHMYQGEKMKSPVGVEYRKLQVTGGSTYIVSLPKRWIKENNLKPSDTVGIEHLSSGEIQISPKENKNLRRTVDLDLAKYPRGALYDYLIGIYVSGADLITIRDKTGLGIKERRIIRQFLRDTRGMEISLDEDNSITIVSLLNPNELPLQVSLNRMYLLVTSLVEDSYGVLSGEDVEELSDHDDRERQIDARRLLVDRQVAMALNSPHIERALGINRYQAMQHGAMSHYLERMGDHAYQFAKLVFETSGEVSVSLDTLPMTSIPVWLSALRSIIRNTYSKEMSVLVDEKLRLKNQLQDLQTHEDELMSSKDRAQNVLIEFKISETIRRLCGYSIDLTETLINMMMAERTNLIEANETVF